jgi:hypothetical protein
MFLTQVYMPYGDTDQHRHFQKAIAAQGFRLGRLNRSQGSLLYSQAADGFAGDRF